MLSNLFAVDRNGCFKVHCAEMEQNMPGPLRRNVDNSMVPKLVLFRDVRHHSRKRRLSRKRHQNLPRKCRRLLRPFRSNGEIPKPIQIHPLIARQLRPGIFAQRLIRLHVFGPARHQRRLRRLPLAGSGNEADCREQNDK